MSDLTILRGIPGKPPPDPTSSTTPFCGKLVATSATSESTKCLMMISLGSMIAVRLIALIPLNEMSEIAHELLGLVFPDCQPKFLYGTNREFAQFWFMFHVEQLRESADEVKTFLNG